MKSKYTKQAVPGFVQKDEDGNETGIQEEMYWQGTRDYT